MNPLNVGLESHSQLTSIEDIDMSGDLEGFEEVIELEEDDTGILEEEETDLLDDDTDEQICNNNKAGDNLMMGRCFRYSEEAYDFYNNYARSKGFGIRKRYSNKRKETQEVY